MKWLALAFAMLATPAFAQSTAFYQLTVTGNDPQITSTGGLLVSCHAPPGEHVAPIYLSGVSPGSGFTVNDPTGSFTVNYESDGIWLEVAAGGVNPALCTSTPPTTIQVSVLGCISNFVFDGTQPCDFVAFAQ